MNILRSSEHFFIGLLTLRDLIKWGNRKHDDKLTTKESVFLEGYCILAERIRDESVKLQVKSILERVFRV